MELGSSVYSRCPGISKHPYPLVSDASIETRQKKVHNRELTAAVIVNEVSKSLRLQVWSRGNYIAHWHCPTRFVDSILWLMESGQSTSGSLDHSRWPRSWQHRLLMVCVVFTLGEICLHAISIWLITWTWSCHVGLKLVSGTKGINICQSRIFRAVSSETVVDNIKAKF